MLYKFDQLKEADRSNFVRYNPAFLRSIFGDANIQPFWVADTDFEVMPELKKALIARAEMSLFGYETKSPELKQAVANWYASRYGITINPRKLLFTASVNTSIAAIIDEFSNQGEGVIIQPPVYQAFAGIITGLKREVINNPLMLVNNHYKMDFDDLEIKAREPNAKILLLCSPHNPVGRVWQQDELTKVSQICSENNLLLITDEIHGDVVYSPNKYIGTLPVYEPYGDSIIMVSSGGKTFGMPGLVDSFIFTPNTNYHKLLHSRIERYHMDKSNAFANTAWQKVYENGGQWLDEMTNYLKGNIDYISNFLATELPEINLPQPEGTYQIWLDFRALKMENEVLAKFLASKAKMALNQGYTYGQGGDGFARMNIASPRSILMKAMEGLAKAVKDR